MIDIKRYFEYKQKILEENGVKTVLTPNNCLEPMEEQIWDSFIKNLKDDFYLDSDMIICPYCYKYKDCDNCVMIEKGNFCHDEKSTYKQVLKELNANSIVEAIPDIRKKIIEFIEEKKNEI